MRVIIMHPCPCSSPGLTSPRFSIFRELASPRLGAAAAATPRRCVKYARTWATRCRAQRALHLQLAFRGRSFLEASESSATSRRSLRKISALVSMPLSLSNEWIGLHDSRDATRRDACACTRCLRYINRRVTLCYFVVSPPSVALSRSTWMSSSCGCSIVRIEQRLSVVFYRRVERQTIRPCSGRKIFGNGIESSRRLEAA